jgi:hypothetical protein
MPIANLLEQELDDLYKQASAGQARGERFGRVRRRVAYTLKIIAAGGSLFVATGLFPSWHQGVGIAVLLAVFADTISSNHKRLLAEVEAGYAFRSIRSRVKREFNREASELYVRKDAGDATAQPLIDGLMKKAHVVLSESIEKIEATRDQADIEGLRALSLDQERAALAP